VSAAPLPRILLVDDERHILDGLRRQLRTEFSVETAVGGPEGLARLGDAGTFAVVVSDYQMPQMNGAAFLAAVREQAPDTTRMLLTGQADLGGAATVVNEGRVFRFLLKPISREDLVAALRAGVEQHRLVTAERELLERTLRGSVKALTELLSLASPLAFARATRLRRLADLMLTAADEPVPWHVDLAVMLSQVGSIALPPSVLERMERNLALEPEEQAMVSRLPALAEQVLAGIPRLEEVRAAIRDQDTPYGDEEDASGKPRGERPPLGARVLRIVRDYDALASAGRSSGEAMRALRTRPGTYDPRLLSALASALVEENQRELVTLPVDQLEPGMVLADAIYTESGVKLVPAGQEITISLLERIRNFSRMASGVREPLRVLTGSGRPGGGS
jgi:response regulator RpfG family c-di-GMP phosphodiesterase